jgi:arylsulfatase A-like enzyme
MTRSISRRDFFKISGAALFGAALAGYSNRLIGERLVQSQLVDPPPNAPNVILIVMDTVRAQSMSLLGYPRETTPNLKQLAQSGVNFTHAVATAPWTLASHASMFTGRYPFELKVDDWQGLDTTFPTIAEAFRDSGYNTAGFISNTFYCSYEFGLNRGFNHYEDYRTTPGQTFLSDSYNRELFYRLGLKNIIQNYKNFDRKSAGQVRSDFLHWLTEVKGTRPFFAFLNFFDTHDPYLAPLDYARKFADKKPEAFLSPELVWTLDPEVLQELNTAYDGSIAYVDDQIGKLVNDLDQMGQLDNTLIVITSDHGEQFGEHRLIGHMNSLYHSLLHVPLLFLFPGRIPANQSVSARTSLIDLPATILELTNPEKQLQFPGNSLSRYWTSNPTDSEVHLAELNNHAEDYHSQAVGKGIMRSLYSGDIHYIKNPDSSEELYDLALDPTEQKNLSREPASRELLQDLRNYLQSVS